METLQRLRMSWDEYLALPEKPKAEWVDGEVVVSPPTSAGHGSGTAQLIIALGRALPNLRLMTEVGVWLPRNRLRAPDVMLVERRPEGAWVEDTPVLVAEVLSPSTRSEDLLRKSAEYLAAGISQYWVLDPDGGSLEVFANGDGEWESLLRLDKHNPTGEVTVGEHGTVPLDIRTILA